MRFKNINNNYVEECSVPWMWSLFFGSLYFAFKGVWSHTLISIILAFVTFGLSWLIYPFFAKGIIRKKYLRDGWIELNDYNQPLYG